MTVTFMRHAESVHNSKGILAGTTDTPCTESGLLEARALAEKFDGKFDAYYVSPLTRTRQTAAAVAPSATFTTDERIIERAFGVWESVSFEEIGKQPFIDVVFNDAPLKGSETNVSVAERITNFIEYLKEKYKVGDKILVVTHGGIMIVLQQKFAKDQEVPHNLGTLTLEL